MSGTKYAVPVAGVCARIARGSRFGVFSSLSKVKTAFESKGLAIAMIEKKKAIGRFKASSGANSGDIAKLRLPVPIVP